MNLNYIKDKLKKLKGNEELIVETEKEMLVGRLENVDVNLNFVKLNFVRDIKHNVFYTSVQLIPVKRIKYIKLVKDDDCSFASATENTADSSEESSSSTGHLETANRKNDSLPKTTLTHLELQLVQKQIGNIKVLNSLGRDYEDAIADIKARSIVALEVEPHQSGRNRKTAVITIATESTVYIFDILSLGKMFEDLKTLLRSDRPCKAMHNSRLVADHFEHRHKLHLNGISDTFVAYSIVTKQKRYIDFEDIIEQYFGISHDFFEEQNDKSYIMYSRPLNESFITNCAKRASFLLKLNECLQKHMLRQYYSQCKSFSRTYADNTDASEVANSIENKDDSGHEYIQALDLNDQSL